MKIVLKKLYPLFAFLFGILEIFAKNDKPPAPTARSTAAAAGPIIPPGLPINDHIIWLIILAVLLGFYAIYKYNQNIKPTA